jgi:hypothetical protein
VFDLLIVFGFVVVVLCCGIGSSAARRSLLIGSLLVVATVASGIWDYLRVLELISARPNPALSDLFDGLNGLLVNADIRETFIAHASKFGRLRRSISSVHRFATPAVSNSPMTAKTHAPTALPRAQEHSNISGMTGNMLTRRPRHANSARCV